MLQVNLNGSDKDIEREIVKHCSTFGPVTSVKIHRSPSPFALVEMSRREQTFELTAQFGGSTFGACALIHLEQETK